MSDLETKAAGLFLAGHYRDGVSLSDSILSGCNVVERVEERLAAGATSLSSEGTIAARTA